MAKENGLQILLKAAAEKNGPGSGLSGSSKMVYLVPTERAPVTPPETATASAKRPSSPAASPPSRPIKRSRPSPDQVPSSSLPLPPTPPPPLPLAPGPSKPSSHRRLEFKAASPERPVPQPIRRKPGRPPAAAAAATEDAASSAAFGGSPRSTLNARPPHEKTARQWMPGSIRVGAEFQSVEVTREAVDEFLSSIGCSKWLQEKPHDGQGDSGGGGGGDTEPPTITSPRPVSASPLAGIMKKKPRAVFSPAARQTMLKWLCTDSHMRNPYPTADECRELAASCGQTDRAVYTWFINMRERIVKPFWFYQHTRLTQKQQSEPPSSCAAGGKN